MLPPSSTDTLSFHASLPVYQPHERRLFDLFHRLDEHMQVRGWEEHLWPTRRWEHLLVSVGMLLVAFGLGSMVLALTHTWGWGHVAMQVVVWGVGAWLTTQAAGWLDRAYQPLFRGWMMAPSVHHPSHALVLYGLHEMAQQSVHLEWLERLEEVLGSVEQWPYVYWEMLEQSIPAAVSTPSEDVKFDDALQILRQTIAQRSERLKFLHEHT